MKHSYAYRTDPTLLIEAGSERLWFDGLSDRLNRAAMMTSKTLREGDTILILSIHNFAGSPGAYNRWRENVKGIGVKLEVVVKVAPLRPVGRPRVYDPTPERALEHWAIWIDGYRTEKDRQKAIADSHGVYITRQTLNARYGNPSNPKSPPAGATS